MGDAGVSVQTQEDDKDNLYNIVGFQVLPCSVSKEVQDSETFDPRECTEYPKQYVSPGTSVQYSYSVFFEKTDISWSDRWMPFLHVRGNQCTRVPYRLGCSLHWFSLSGLSWFWSDW